MRYLAVAVLLSACFALVACSSSSAPEPGTAAFHWAAAKTSYHTGDYTKANGNLNALFPHDNELIPKAQPWSLVLSTGIVHGLAELSDAYAAGVKENQANALALRQHVYDCRRLANSVALDGVDVFRSFLQKSKEPQVLLDFEYPPLDPIEPADLKSVARGAILPLGDRDALQRTMIQRGVIHALAQIVGTPDDPSRAAALFKSPPVQIPREKFLFGMAQLLYDQAQLYDRKHIDDPRRADLFYTLATETLKGLPPEKPVEDLLKKIQQFQKEPPRTAT